MCASHLVSNARISVCVNDNHRSPNFLLFSVISSVLIRNWVGVLLTGKGSAKSDTVVTQVLISSDSSVYNHYLGSPRNLS